MKLAIFSDLDGTLLDRETFLPGPALVALEKCRKLGIPVNLVSGKTRAEMEEIRVQLGLATPFISENGGGLYVPEAFFPDVARARAVDGYYCFCGQEKIGEIRRALEEIARETEIAVRAFYRMTPEEISRLTGLTLSQVEKARQREFDEPFVIEDETPRRIEAVKAAIIGRGLCYSHGGSLHHIMGKFDKGQRTKHLKGLYLRHYPEMKFAAIGDALNDLPMLRLADHPFLVRRPDGSFDESLHFEGLTITRGIGPAGFAEMVETLTII